MYLFCRHRYFREVSPHLCYQFKKTHTVLSTDKLQQIAGRCRDAEGLLSETIIYSTKAVLYDIDPNNIENQVLEDAQQLSIFGTLYPILQEKFTSNFYLFREEFDSKELIEGTANVIMELVQSKY